MSSVPAVGTSSFRRQVHVSQLFLMVIAHGSIWAWENYVLGPVGPKN